MNIHFLEASKNSYQKIMIIIEPWTNAGVSFESQTARKIESEEEKKFEERHSVDKHFIKW